MLELGPFDLIKTIGSGGMGEIWHARHGDQGIPVAIKVIREQVTEEFREAFLHEVRLVAGLQHPNVILALDAGTVPEKAAAASGGQLVAGAPYLAMELAGGGSLDRVRIRRFGDLRHVLAGLLQGLAHAHARGVVHRDIKPGNLLLAGQRTEIAARPRELRQARMVLTDFGISSHKDLAEIFGDEAIGTPAYMAPEQVRGDWRDQGPWTDLYAVGVMAFKLTCGRVPFKRSNSAQTMLAHLRQPVPPLQPLYDVPAELEGWIRKLLAKLPADRFGFASDAHRELMAMVDPTEESLDDQEGVTRRMPPIRDLLAGRSEPSLPGILDDTELPTERNTAMDREISLITGGLRSTGASTATGRGKWSPKAWSDTGRRDFRLEGAGLGLYGLRPIPLVDRVAERDRLWGSLVAVRAGGEPRAVVLRGPSGTGKSRLARWLAETAHEAGAGRTVEVGLRTATGGAVLNRLAEAAVRSDGLPKPEVLLRCKAILGQGASEESVEVLARLAAPQLWPSETPSRAESHAVLEALLRAVAGERTAVLWLDDAHLSVDAIQLAVRLVRSREPLSVLVVLTVEDEALAERPDAQEALAKLVDRDVVDGLNIGPLGAEDHQELVRKLLGLEGSVAVKVEQKTAGNPLFAVQLVGEWIARGLLVPSERGFRLADPDAPIPDDLLAVWEQRVEEFLVGRAEDDARALELGAVFGQQMRQVQFRRLCRGAGIAPALDLIDGLMKRGLARPVDELGRWGLVHGMVREVLLRRAKAAGRWAEHHRACADHLVLRGVHEPERLARHLVEAGALEEALDPLNTAITERLAAGDFRSSELVQKLDRALHDLKIPSADPRWGGLWLQWAWLFRVRGENAEAERYVVRAERAARRSTWPLVLAKALRLGARIERNLGRDAQALEMIDEAQALFEAEGDVSRVAACGVLRGDILFQRSELDQASAAFRGAVGISEDPQDEVEAWMGLARVAQRQGDTEAFTTALERTREAAVQAGRRNALARVANLQGELARKLGDLELAEQFYREAVRRALALDDAHAVYAQLNVGLLMVMRGAWNDAIALLEPIRARAERGGVKSIPACFARAVLLPCMAGTEDWSRFKDHYRWLKGYLEGKALYDGDLARMCALAAELAEQRGRPDGAIAATRLAMGQYEGLGRTEDLAAARQRLAELER